MTTIISLGYWNIRGLAQPIRNLLEYTDEKYEDRIYDFDTSDMTNKIKVCAYVSQLITLHICYNRS